jgi:hypothetical protein
VDDDDYGEEEERGATGGMLGNANPKYSEKNLPSAFLSTTDLT